MKRESDIQRECMRVLKEWGCQIVYRMNSGKVKVKGGWLQLAPEGTPDLLAFYGLFFLWVEVKQPGEHATPEQQAMHALLRSMGHVVIVVDNPAALFDHLMTLGHEHGLQDSLCF